MSAFILATQALRRAVPGTETPVLARSQRLSAGWLLCNAEGGRLATVLDSGEVTPHPGDQSQTAFAIRVEVRLRKDLSVESRWRCPCGARWIKPGRHDDTYHTCKDCGQGAWLRLG